MAVGTTFALVAGLVVPEPAHAYIDPTAAGAALQSLYVILASAVVGLAVVPMKVKAGIDWVKAKVTGKSAAAPSPTSEEPPAS